MIIGRGHDLRAFVVRCCYFNGENFSEEKNSFLCQVEAGTFFYARTQYHSVKAGVLTNCYCTRTPEKCVVKKKTSVIGRP